MHQNCIGINCDYYFCNKNNKCLWSVPMQKKNHIAESIISKIKNKRAVQFNSAGTKVRTLIKQGHEPICVCCGHESALTFDHIIPLSKGGLNNLENGQILCFKCNARKADKIITIEQLKKSL